MEASNVKAMHDALVKIEKMAHCDLCNVYPKYRDKFNDIIGGIEHEARAALAELPRNCDVGTEQEQADRYEVFCAKHFAKDRDDDPCGSCPLSSQANLCKFAWAQMPYKKGGAK